MAERGAAGQKRAEDAAGCPVDAGVLWHNEMYRGGLRRKTFDFLRLNMYVAGFHCGFVGKSGPSVYTKPSRMSRAVLKAASRSLPLCPPAPKVFANEECSDRQ